MRFFCRTTAGRWEEVTKYVFDNLKYVVNENDTARYGIETIVLVNSKAIIHGSIPIDELGSVCRFLGAKYPHESTKEGFYDEPETLKIVRGSKEILHVLKTGENWSKKKSKSNDPTNT